MNNNIYKPVGTLIDNFVNHSLSNVFGAEMNSRMNANIIEKDDAFIIELAVPGMSKDDINMEVVKDHLIISSNVDSDEANETEGVDESENNSPVKRSIFGNQSFKRSFHLGDSIDRNAITAYYDNGLLIVTANKKESAKESGPIVINVK